MQVFALAGIALFLIAFLVVPLLRVIVVAFTGPDGGFTLVHFGDFFATGLLREVVLEFDLCRRDDGGRGEPDRGAARLPSLARFRFRGAALIQTLGVLPLVMPPFVGAVAMQLHLTAATARINLLLNDWFGFTHPVHGGLERRHLRRGAALLPVHPAQPLGRAAPTSIRRWRNPRRTSARAASRCSAASCFRWRCRATSRAPRWSSSRCSTISPRRCCSTSPTCWRRRPICEITSVGIADPMGYVISVIMIVLLARRDGGSAPVPARARLRHPAARRRRAVAARARPAGSAIAAAFVVADPAARAVAAYRHSAAVDRDRVVVRRAARRLTRSRTTPRVFREADAADRQHAALLRLGRPDRRRARRRASPIWCCARGCPAGGCSSRSRWRRWRCPGWCSASDCLRTYYDVKLPFTGEPLATFWFMLVIAYAVRRLPYALRACDRRAAADCMSASRKPPRISAPASSARVRAHRGAADDRRPARRLRHELRHRRGRAVGDADAGARKRRRAAGLWHLRLHAVGGRARAGRGARRHRGRGRRDCAPTSPIASRERERALQSAASIF